MPAELPTACVAAADSAPPGAVPPKIRKGTALPGVFTGVVLGLTFLGAGAVIFFFNPSTHGFYPVCEFHELTGLNCPGCGGTRSAYALLHGHFERALKDNALFVLLLPAMALRGAWLAGKKYHGKPVGELIPVKALWLLLVVAMVFTVLRNLPAFAFLSP